MMFEISLCPDTSLLKHGLTDLFSLCFLSPLTSHFPSLLSVLVSLPPSPPPPPFCTCFPPSFTPSSSFLYLFPSLLHPLLFLLSVLVSLPPSPPPPPPFCTCFPPSFTPSSSSFLYLFPSLLHPLLFLVPTQQADLCLVNEVCARCAKDLQLQGTDCTMLGGQTCNAELFDDDEAKCKYVAH